MRKTFAATPVVVASVVVAAATWLAQPGVASTSRQQDNASVGGALKPPVITEDFRPLLECNPNTTVGQEGCGEHEVVVADRQLNADVKVVFSLLANDGARSDLVAAQTAWLTYRRTDCVSESDVYQGGSEQPVVYVNCLSIDDGSRRQELKTFFGLLTQGRPSVPKFP